MWLVVEGERRCLCDLVLAVRRVFIHKASTRTLRKSPPSHWGGVVVVVVVRGGLAAGWRYMYSLHPRPRFAFFVMNGLPRVLAADEKKERPEAAQAKAPPAAVGGPVRPFGSFWLFWAHMPFWSFLLAISELGWVARKQ